MNMSWNAMTTTSHCVTNIFTLMVAIWSLYPSLFTSSTSQQSAYKIKNVKETVPGKMLLHKIGTDNIGIKMFPSVYE